MIDFDFINPTRIIFGKGKENEVGNIIAEYGFKRVLVVYGGNSTKKSGLYDRVIARLDEKGIFHCELGGITPNPELKFVIEGRKIARENKIDMILAVGGGSVIDTSKAVAASYYYSGDPFDFNLKKVTPDRTIRVGVILTISSAGSESSDSCVITNPETKRKQGFNHWRNRPLFAIENPELTYSVSKYQTAIGTADIMMHSMERYFNFSEENQLCDDLALAVVKNAMISGKNSVQNPTNYEARGQMMLASSLAHDGLTSIGKVSQFVVHPLEHAVSGYRPDVPHGAGIAICYLGWAKYVYKQDLPKFARLSRYLFNIDVEDDEKAAIIGIEAMRDFYLSIGLPTRLSEFGITESDLPILADLATGNGTRVIGRCPQSLDKKDVEAIYRLCL
ncbi:MAG: iron-containing alcohol dehydrogenase [Bacilli bacterium]|nr:iron-containing alcohol dehydrogenase [Bacilli bacterium]